MLICETTNTNFLENRKHELLAAIYSKDHQNALKILNDVCRYVRRFLSKNTPEYLPFHPSSALAFSYIEPLCTKKLALNTDENSAHSGIFFSGNRLIHAPDENSAQSPFSENDEKILNQIVLISKTFAPQMQNYEREKFLYLQKQIKQALLKNYTKAKLKLQTISFEDWKKHLDLRALQMELVFKSAMALQLTKGCSNFCRRCNEWALPKVRANFSYQAITSILAAIDRQKNYEISLYSASDPLDWEESSKNILNIINYINKNLSLKYSLLTKIPKGKNRVLAALIKSNANISVSMTLRNKKRIQALESELDKTIAKQHDTNDLLIPAYLDEDFLTVKPSITDGYGTEITPDGAFIIIPTFTCALHPLGHKKIPINKETDFFPIKKTARQALLVDYFKPLQGHKLQGHNIKIVHLETLLDVQVETILLDSGKEELTPPGMRSLKEYFGIFDSKARFRRKQMTKTVLKKLKYHYIDNTHNFKSLPQELQKEYLTKIKTHLELCKKEKCLEAQKNAASFFLSAIMAYVKNNPVKSQIILHLVRDEIALQKSTFKQKDLQIAKEFLDEKTNAFELFRTLALQILLANPTITHKTEQFIQAHPASYEPAADIFVEVKTANATFRELPNI